MGQDGAGKKIGFGPGNGNAVAGRGGEAATGPGPESDGRGVQAILQARAATHGDFTATALVAQMLRDTLRAGPRWPFMTASHKLAIEEITLKLARIVCGDPAFPDHWLDIEGYARKGGGA